MLDRMRSDLRVQFIHGLESSPQGVKAQLLARHFTARTPAMDTRDFAASVRAQAEALREFDPHVVVGSSYGGAIAVELLQRGLWRGPTLLLAQAALRRGQPAVLPAGVAIWLVHGTRDAIIDPEAERDAAAREQRGGAERLREREHVAHRDHVDALVEADALGDRRHRSRRDPHVRIRIGRLPRSLPALRIRIRRGDLLEMDEVIGEHDPVPAARLGGARE